MKPRIGNVMLGVILVILLTAGAGEAATWTTLDFPGATATYAMDIDGEYIVGGYSDGSHNHGFVYDGTTWTPLNYPGALHTEAWGIDGGKIVGMYNDGSERGFLYDGTTWTPLDYPGASLTIATGIDGGNIVGSYINGGRHGFLYDGTTWTPLDYPWGSRTQLNGIDGSNIVGTYGFYRGVIYDGTNWTPLDYPGSSSTGIAGIDDGNIVGDHDDDHGYLYDGETETWTTIDFPDSTATDAYGISGSKIVGRYCDSSGKWHGFLYTASIEATIDIYPNRTPNRIYLSRLYTVYVAVLGSADFDVTTLDSATVKFGRTGTEASPGRAYMLRDLNRDGFVDAMYGFLTPDCGFQLGDTQGRLTGHTADGTPVEGVDSVLVSP
ncbi:MAG: hypothetical protein ACYSWQ_12130 [Planctomycetota bacterium]|jgi:hypothetical protein